MLNYLVDMTIQLITLMIAAGLSFACSTRRYDAIGRKIIWIGLAAGLASAVVMTVLRNTTNLIDTPSWNLRIYLAAAGAYLLFILFTAFGRWLRKAGQILQAAMLAFLLMLLMLYFLPTFLESLYLIVVAETTLFSTNTLLKMVGVALALILTFVTGYALSRGTRSLGKGTLFALVTIVFGINTVKQMAAAFGIMMSKRMITNNHGLFMFVRYAANYSDYFIYATMLAALVGIVIALVKTFTFHEPFSNPAEHRKIIAKWRRLRRWGFLALGSLAVTVFVMTAVNAYVNQEVELSPIEDAVEEDGNVVVSFAQVEDGHLHRFGYTTENGVTIRFIVIQKPNSSAYGIGLDACDICGETGYYEKDGNVICNRCDVVMNINTIGFQGGCNPIVIDYSISNNKIYVPIAGLLEYESEFA